MTETPTNPNAIYVIKGVAWLLDDARRAEREGWNVFATSGARWHTPLEIERIDEEGKFEDDDEAFQHVLDQALRGQLYAIRALAICLASQMEQYDEQANEWAARDRKLIES